jgi:hypothetical protein
LKKRKFFALCAAVLFVLCFTVMATGSEIIPVKNKVADVSIGSYGIHWQPKVSYGKISLTVACADGQVFQQTFESGAAPYFSLSDLKGQAADGPYTYELRVSPFIEKKVRRDGNKGKDEKLAYSKTLTQSGYFHVKGGGIVTAGARSEDPAKPLDIVHSDDVIIDGSLCVGLDCADGYDFGFSTIALRENNLRIFFDDTSIAEYYPRNDWRLVANDTTSGGGNYFAIQDATGVEDIFVVEAGASANSLYVDSSGNIGLNTAAPVMELHIVDGDTPCIRLAQDSTVGFSPQTWDIGGNETNFFVRDVTHASNMPIRIVPEAPTNSIYINSDGKIGMGTAAPDQPLEVQTTGTAATILAEQTDGASGCISAGGSYVFIGSKSNNDFRLIANDSPQMTIETGGDVGIGLTNPGYKLHISGGAYCDGGAWVPGSSREYKENITDLTLNEAMSALENLAPVKFNYKTNKDEDYMGFIAEDVPELVATKERKGVAPMDVVAVLTKVLQDQQKMVQEQQEAITVLKQEIAELKKKL